MGADKFDLEGLKQKGLLMDLIPFETSRRLAVPQRRKEYPLGF